MNLQRLFSEPIGNGVEVNLNEMAKKAHPFIKHTYAMEQWINSIATSFGDNYTYGGYLEDRSYIWRDTYLKTENCIHLGVDINITRPIGVVCPVPFKVVDIFDDTDQNGGWGRRVTVETDRGYVVFAHLEPGEDKMIGYLAPPERNGNWFTHLHIQGIKDLG